MARRGDHRKSTLVRNVTIICAVLVVFIMSLERSMVKEVKSHTVEVNVDVENQIHLGVEDSESTNYWTDSESEEVPEAKQLTAEPPTIKSTKLPVTDDRAVKTTDSKEVTDNKHQLPESSKEILDDHPSESEEVIITPVDTTKTDGLLNPEPPPVVDPDHTNSDPYGHNTDPKSPSSPPSDAVVPPSDPKIPPSEPTTPPSDSSHSSPYGHDDTVTPPNGKGSEEEEVDEDSEHHHHHSDEDEITITPTEPPVDLSRLSPAELEKYKRKKAENDEKAKLEAMVLKEYEDELKNSNASLATPTRNPASPLLLPKPLLFLHVPKTAGSTLAQVFKNNEKSSKYYHFWSQPRLSELPIVPTRDTIFGHFRYGLHFYCNKSTATYATMLREPVDRVISYYHFHLQDKQDPAHQFAVDHTFEEWLDLSPAAQNEMTKSLSGIRSEHIPSMKSFEMAKHHLSKMGYVGLTERFDESLVLMKYYLGFDNLKYDNTKVGVKKPKEIAPAVIEKIKKLNWMDIILYDMAKERFEKELAEVSRYLLQQEMGKSKL